jgi:hypothetical protein
VRTEGRFVAPDPWNGGRSTEWSIEGYLHVPDHWQGLPASAMKKKSASYAIRSEIDGVERFLPDSLGHLVRTSAVPPAALPELLRELEPECKEVDYKPMLRMNIRRNIRIYTGVAIVCLIWWYILHTTAAVPPPIGDRGPLWRMLLLTTGLTGLVCTVLVGPLAMSRLKRRERQMEWATQRAAGLHA